MNIWKIAGALVLTPFVAVGIIYAIIIFGCIMDEYGNDILGIVFLLGWLALIFSIVYRLL